MIRILAFLAITASLVSAQCNDKVGGVDSKLALDVIRMINTIENEIHVNRGRYVSLSELASSDELKALNKSKRPSAATYAAISNKLTSDSVDGYTINVISEDAHYVVSTVARDSCSTSYFSNQRGVIFEGKPLQPSDSNRLGGK